MAVVASDRFYAAPHYITFRCAPVCGWCLLTISYRMVLLLRGQWSTYSGRVIFIIICGWRHIKMINGWAMTFWTFLSQSTDPCICELKVGAISEAFRSAAGRQSASSNIGPISIRESWLSALFPRGVCGGASLVGALSAGLTGSAAENGVRWAKSGALVNSVPLGDAPLAAGQWIVHEPMTSPVPNDPRAIQRRGRHSERRGTLRKRDWPEIGSALIAVYSGSVSSRRTAFILGCLSAIGTTRKILLCQGVC